MKDTLVNRINRFRKIFVGDIANRIDVNTALTAQLHIERVRQLEDVESLSEVEFKVFSQWGEDGIIQYLINRVAIESERFVEFGVENYLESNTRFLLTNNNWKGLVLDGSQSHIASIRRDTIYWKHDLTARQKFVTRENINDTLASCGFEGDIGLLSIDIDGNDYWIWDRLDVIEPQIVVCEYNSVFGAEAAITVPYDAEFVRTEAHFSNLYFGASLAALCQLAERKGYSFVGSNSVGTNAFFVRKDLANNLRAYSAAEGYVESKLRESRDPSGELSFVAGRERLRLIADLPVHDVERDVVVPISDVL